MNYTNIVDLFIEQGADWSFDFPVDPDIDLTNGSAAMMIKTLDGSTTIATLTTAGTGLILNASLNTITATIRNAQTSNFVPGNYKYDIKFQGTNNIIYRTNEGNGIVDPQVTNIPPPSNEGIPVTANGEIVTANGQTVTT